MQRLPTGLVRRDAAGAAQFDPHQNVQTSSAAYLAASTNWVLAPRRSTAT